LNENDTGEVAGFLNALDAKLRHPLKCSVLLVHHVGHGSKDRARGSYTLMSNTDANYLLERPDPKELTIKLTTGRLKDSDSPAPLFMKARIVELGTQDEDGEPETSLVLLPTEERPAHQRKRPTGKQQMALLNLLEQEHREGRITWTIGTIRELARDRLEIKKQTAHDATNALVNNGFLKMTIGGVVLADPPSERKP
jgi:hypothetical protein